MSFPNKRDVERGVSALDKHINEGIALRDDLKKFLDEPKPSAPPSRSEEVPNGAWRGHPASEKQLRILDQYKVYHHEGITKGEAADLIQDLFARRDK